MAHTPGPWTVEDPFGPENLAIVPAAKPTHEWVIIATCSHDEDQEDDGRPRILVAERDANARLIASAPEMLEALKTAVRIADEARDEWDKAPSDMRAGKLLIALSGHLKGYRPDIDSIHAAIAKATRGTS